MSALADPEKNLVPELGILGVEIDARALPRGDRSARSLRNHRRRPRCRPGKRGPSAAEGRHTDAESKADDHAARSREALRSLTPGSPVTLQIQREGRLMFVSFTLE